MCLSLTALLTACNIVVYRNTESKNSEPSVESVESVESTQSVESIESTTSAKTTTEESQPTSIESVESQDSETEQSEESEESEESIESVESIESTQSEEESEEQSEEQSEEESESELPPEPVYPKYDLNKTAAFDEKDGGNFYQTEVSGHLYDVIGFETLDNGFASIKQKEYGTYTYHGMIYNRSIIDGLKSITVNFDDTKDLYVVFSEYLMEDMTFTLENKISNGEKIQAGENKGYFVMYTDSTEKVDITSISIEYDDEQSFADSMLYTPSNAFGGYARSAASKYNIGYDLIDVTNNPTATTNNYSEGMNTVDNRTNRWHRWNGIYLGGTDMIWNKFSIHITIIGNISQMIDPDNMFCYSVWPAFIKDGEDPYDISDGWSYVMIGNDDYEPLGDSPEAVNTDYGGFTGRFVTLYSGAHDPDVETTKDGTKTFRQVYETYNLPFWNVEFVYDGNDYEVIVNGMNIGGYSLYDDGSDPNYPLNYFGEDFAMKYFELHLVNYGKGPSGEHYYDPAPKYSGTFTMPRIKKVNNA